MNICVDMYVYEHDIVRVLVYVYMCRYVYVYEHDIVRVSVYVYMCRHVYVYEQDCFMDVHMCIQFYFLDMLLDWNTYIPV